MHDIQSQRISQEVCWTKRRKPDILEGAAKLALMHEISIMYSMLETAEEYARKANASEVRVIRLRVGLLSGVVPEALEFAFDALKKGSMAERASLEIERVPSHFRCSECGGEFTLETIQFVCPQCGGMLVLQRGGAELELTQLEVS
jgi:hydrogenase nickel incorporation protein HypA/HybF